MSTLLETTRPSVEGQKKGYRYRIYPSDEQKVLLAQTFGCCRHIWNCCLDYAIKAWEAHKTNPMMQKPNVSGFGFANAITQIKQDPEKPWLNDVTAVALQQTGLDLGRAFLGLFKGRTKYPKFKKKSNHQSFRLLTNAFSLKDSGFYIAKCKTPIKVKWSRALPSSPTSVTISMTPSGKYYASFICSYTPVPTAGTGTEGIDLGIKDLAFLASGEAIGNPKYFVKAQKQLKKLQRRLSKKEKGSKNRTKARLKVAKLHEYVSSCRLDYIHKLTTRLVRENQTLCIEDLNVSGMSKNRKLAKHILDASFATVRTMLQYKVRDSQHCNLVIVDRFYPSTQLCSACNQKPSVKIALRVRDWQCEYCGKTHGRDQNAASNLMLVAKRMEPFMKDKKGHVFLADEAAMAY